jgi:hypothetical protein
LTRDGGGSGRRFTYNSPKVVMRICSQLGLAYIAGNQRRLAGAKMSINQWQAFNRNQTAFCSIMINESEPAVSERCGTQTHAHIGRTEQRDKDLIKRKGDFSINKR